MITLHKIWIVCESAIVFVVAWFADLFIVKFSGLSIVSPMLKEVLVDFKEVIGALVLIATLILTILRIKNENKKLKDK